MCVPGVVGEAGKVLKKMAKTEDENGEQQPLSIMADEASRIGRLKFRITSRQPMATYLAHPSVTPKDTRPRFCNPSSLSSHSLIYSLTAI